ncbi:MAG: hypothetical protein ABI758_05570 [Candidatus Woesebacteria bacterium]
MESAVERNKEIVHKKILLPLERIFTQPILPSKKKPRLKKASRSQTNTFDELFPEQEIQGKDVQRTKEILGTLAKEFSEDEVQDIVSQIQCLTESWMDEFEREIFDERTLNQLLHEKGGL